MNPSERLREKLNNWRPTGREQLELNLPEQGWQIDLTADAVDRVAGEYWEVAIRRLAPLSNAAPLAERAATIAERVSGLLEPLAVIEVDAASGVAMLRSDKPSLQGGALRFYEMLLQADGSASLRRFESAEPRRKQIALALTHEVLTKLVADVTA